MLLISLQRISYWPFWAIHRYTSTPFLLIGVLCTMCASVQYVANVALPCKCGTTNFKLSFAPNHCCQRGQVNPGTKLQNYRLQRPNFTQGHVYGPSRPPSRVQRPSDPQTRGTGSNLRTKGLLSGQIGWTTGPSQTMQTVQYRREQDLCSRANG